MQLARRWKVSPSVAGSRRAMFNPAAPLPATLFFASGRSVPGDSYRRRQLPMEIFRLPRNPLLPQDGSLSKHGSVELIPNATWIDRDDRGVAGSLHNHYRDGTPESERSRSLL